MQSLLGIAEREQTRCETSIIQGFPFGKPCLLLLVLAFYQIFGELFGSLLNNPYLCTRNVIAVKFTDVKIYEEFL